MAPGDDVKNSEGETRPETDASKLIMRAKQSEYEVHGLNLNNFLDKDFLQKLTDGFGEIGMIDISFVLIEKPGFVSLTHKKYSDYKNNLLTIHIQDDVSKAILVDVLGIQEE